MIHRAFITPAPRRAALLATLAVAALSVAAMPRAASAAGGDARFTLLRTWQPSLLPPGIDEETAFGSTSMVFDRQRHVLWAVEGAFPAILAAYDADTLRALAPPVVLPGQATATRLDPASGRILVAQTMVNTTHPATDTAPHLDAYALAGGALQLAWHADLSALGPDADIASMHVDHDAGALYVEWEPATAAAAGVDLARFGMGSGAPAFQWTDALPPSCPTTPSVTKGLSPRYDAPAMGFSPARHAVYVLCAVPAALARPQLLSGVGRVTIGPDGSAPATTGAFTLFPVAGDIYASVGSVFDAVSGRLIFDEVGQGGAGSEAVFDTGSDRYVGMVNGSDGRSVGFSIDDVAGRLYLMENSSGAPGLATADVRTTPPSQPTIYPDLNYDNRLYADPGTGDVFVLGATPDGRLVWRVFHDNVPPLDVSSGAADPDSNTHDITENPQTTGATYSASGQSFGIVTRQVGGAESAAQDLAGNFFGVNGNSEPELRAAYVNDISLTADEASASSIAADRDQQTIGGEQAAVCAQTPAQAQSVTCPWPYTPATCSSFGTAASGSDQTPTGSAESTCSLLQRSATTQASVTAANLGEVTAGSASTAAAILEDSVAGVRARVTAEAHNVVALGGALHIARIATVAEAHAHGRPGTASTTFTRDVEGVTLNGTTLCDSPCNLDVVAAEIDAAYSGRVEISFPTPDAGLARGSRGGYQALVRLSDSDHLDDVFNDAQPASRVEVPGMVITLPIDGSRPSRTVVMLAGVEAEARYGIYPLDQFLADQSAGVAPSGGDAVAASSGSILPVPTGLPAVTAGVAPSAPVVSPQPLAAIPTVLGWHGWQWALAHPLEFLRMAAVWVVLLLPVYLSARRWSLLRRHALELDLSA